MRGLTIAEQVRQLKNLTGSDCRVLTDDTSSEFKNYAKRWSDVERQTPAAIVLPTNESDIQKIVRWAVEGSIPFVTRSGGHSLWSTIGPEGFVLDLSLFSGVTVNRQAETATLKGSILGKQVGVELAKHGYFAALGNGNTVGSIPFTLNGGVSVTQSITGFGSDNIVAARLITAAGELIEVNNRSHSELLYALRGAGQFFGLVTELEVKIHPLTALGNDRGVMWTGAFVFPAARAVEVADTMQVIMNDQRWLTAGLILVSAPPPHHKPSVVVAARYYGNPDDAARAYKPLYDLNPLVTQGGEVPIQNAGDARASIGEKGGLKRFGIVGLRRFDVEKFVQTVQLYQDLVAECPDAVDSAFNFQWDSHFTKKPDFETAMCLHDTRFWQNNLIIHTDPSKRAKVDEYNDRCIAITRGTRTSEYADYQNATREGPIGLRYRGAERLERLKALKRKWDPNGVFTRELLD